MVDFVGFLIRALIAFMVSTQIADNQIETFRERRPNDSDLNDHQFINFVYSTEFYKLFTLVTIVYETLELFFQLGKGAVK